ncbi:hypothetical protein [Microbacterium sp.]|uniref:hypothetical protein n=1 Tax=Microbacterium sp. TaxID=51671 RepID=UPI002FE14D45
MTEKRQNDDKNDRQKRPLERHNPLNDAHLMESKRQCPAISKRTGERCKRYCALGMRSCRWHGSATRVAKTAAAKRIAQASGYAADMLVEFMADPEVNIDLRTKIAQDLLNRAGVSEKTVLQIGVEQPRSFLDFVGDALVDVETDDHNIMDAVVIEDDDAPLVPRDPEVQNRHDRAVFAEVERARSRDPKRALSQVERARMEAAERETLGGAPASARSRRASGRSDDDEAMAEQQDREDAELQRVRRAERERNADRAGDRHTRNSEATMSQPRKRQRR